jgi:hypothetical protein
VLPASSLQKDKQRHPSKIQKSPEIQEHIILNNGWTGIKAAMLSQSGGPN